jgi:hypothetical protein
VPSALTGSGLVAQGLDDAIARGLAAPSGSSGSSGGSSSDSGSAAAAGSRLQPQALSAAFGEGESLLGKRRAASTASDVDSDLLDLLSSGR